MVLTQRETWVVEEPVGITAVLVLQPGSINDVRRSRPHRSRAGARLVDLAKELNPDGLDLWTFQSNVGPRRFYERHGFIAVAATSGDDEAGAPDVRFHWSGS